MGLESYINKIRKKYASSNVINRILLLRGLEELINRKEKFDGGRAKKIRLESGLPKIVDLVREIGEVKFVTGDWYALNALISSYENNKRIRKNPLGSRLAPRYLHWLAEHGYDPYGILKGD